MGNEQDRRGDGTCETLKVRGKNEKHGGTLCQRTGLN